ncbi:hypothetical protein [Nocardia sp. NPDC003979]
MRRYRFLVRFASASVLLLAIAGCGKSNDQATTPTEPGGARPVEHNDIMNAEVPSLCKHEPGRLVNGVLGLQDPRRGPVMIGFTNGAEPGTTRPHVAYGDLTGDGVDDAAVAMICTAGGVGWPPSVQLYTDGGARLGGVNMADFDYQESGRGSIETLEIRDRTVYMTWKGYRDNDSGCCPSLPLRGEARWTGTEVVVENVEATE